MPRPLRKIPRPPAQDVVIRRIGAAEPVEVVSPDELARRKEEAEWERYRRSHGLDVWAEHAKLALQLGDAITVPRYTQQVWWLVRDVNGPDRTITAATLLFDQPRERAFPFDLVEVVSLTPYGRNEAAAAYTRLNQLLGKVKRPEAPQSMERAA